MVNRKTFLSPTETSHYAKKKISPNILNYLFVCWTECIHSQERTTLQSWQQIPLFSFFLFLINNTYCQEKCHRFCDLSPRVYEQSYCSWYTTGIIKLSFHVMVAILANKNLFSLHRFFSAKFIKFHNTAVLMSSTWWHHNPSWQSLSILNQPFYLTIFFKAIEDYLCQKNMIVGCVSL